jgi:ParB family chromosome partitioning protein
MKLSMSDIVCDHEFNCRGFVTGESCEELARSIGEIGLINPITVRPMGSGWQVVAGHRRFNAVLSLGWSAIDVVIKVVTIEEAMLINLQENLGRRDLTPSQEMRSIIRIYGNKPNVKLVSKGLGKSKAWVISRLSIRSLPEEVQAQVDCGKLNVSDIRFLVTVPYGDCPSVADMLIERHERDKSTQALKQGLNKTYRAKRKRDLKAALSILEVYHKAPTYRETLAWCLGDLSDEEFLGRKLDEP